MECELMRHAFFYTFQISSFRLHYVSYLCAHAVGAHRLTLLNNLLTFTVFHNKLKLVKKILAAGADIHHYQDQALRWSVMRGQVKMVKFLCRQGADVNADGGEPLLAATTQKQGLKLARILTDYGAHVDSNHVWAAIRKPKLQRFLYHIRRTSIK